jgi:hypothetical protein
MNIHASSKIILLLTLISGTYSLSAQQAGSWSTGALTGASFANASVKNGIPGDYHTMIGFNTDVFLAYTFPNKLSIQTQVGFLQNGYQISNRTMLVVTLAQNQEELESSYSGYDFLYRYNNMVNSWFIGYTIGDKYTVKPQIGLYGGLNLNTYTESSNYLYISPEDHDLIGDPGLPIGYVENLEEGELYKDSFTKYQFGIVSRLALGYRVTEQYRISISSSFYWDLINSASDTQLTGFEQYFRTFTLNIGFTLFL